MHEEESLAGTLKPCPVCGGMPKRYQEGGRWYVRCNILNACTEYPETSPCKTAEEAANEWNNMGRNNNGLSDAETDGTEP